jgi:hypothetical protein
MSKDFCVIRVRNELIFQLEALNFALADLERDVPISLSPYRIDKIGAFTQQYYLRRIVRARSEQKCWTRLAAS